MPKATGRVRKTFDIVFPEMVKTFGFSNSQAADIPEICAIALTNTEKNTVFQLTNLFYNFTMGSPADDAVVAIFLVLGENGSTGDTGTLQDLYSSAIWFDQKYYQMGLGATEWLIVEDSKQVLLDPDVLLQPPEHTQLQIWGNHNAVSDIIRGFVTIQYYKRITQNIYSNDDAFSDMTFDELVGNLQW